MSANWKKFEDAKGFPYYKHESTNSQQWDHPKFEDIIKELSICNYIKLPAYRISSKVRVLQQVLFMEEVHLSTIIGIFECHKLGATESALFLESYDLEAVLSDIYFASNKQNFTNTDIDYATDLMMNFLYNVFDKDRRNNIQVISTKLILALLSKCSESDFYDFLFKLCSDHNNCVTRSKLQAILSKVVAIISFLHEDVYFPHNIVDTTVNNCFQNSPGPIGINESVFKVWLENRISLLSWISNLHRMRIAETVIHNVKCSLCQATICGLRYKCMSCFNYNQCQHCFLSEKVSGFHKVQHSVKEYYTTKKTTDLSHVVFKKILRLLKGSVTTVQPILTVNEPEPKVFRGLKSLITKVGAKNIDPLLNPEAQLQVVIKQLENLNKELQQIADSNKNGKKIKKHLEDHRQQMNVQVETLKILKDYLNNSQHLVTKQPTLKRMESTPMIANTKGIRRVDDLNLLSPISQEKSSRINNYSYPIQTLYDSAVVCPKDDLLHNKFVSNTSMPSYSVKDISTWIGDCPTTSTSDVFMETNVNVVEDNSEVQNNLDEVLAKLQQILANNCLLDESLGGSDNGHLKNAVTEVEGMLTSLIYSV